jgi:hypothetical protein
MSVGPAIVPPVTDSGIAIGGRVLSIDDCMEKLCRYPMRTISRYDLPGPGPPHGLTRDEIVRTREVSSRISDAEVAWFLERAEDAPWPAPTADLREADPGAVSGVYDQLENLYRHFKDAAPHGIATAKISKVLHVKRPAAYPILDQRMNDVYRDAATQAGRRYPRRGHKRAYWAAIRDDLITNTESGAITTLRDALPEAGQVGINLRLVTELRLLDMLTWQ